MASPAEKLRKAFHGGDLVLYLGAGVSMGSGLPSWEKLVLSMYFAAIVNENIGRPYSNYLYAIAEWHLKNVREPAEVVARKVRSMFEGSGDFAHELREQLYASVSGEDTTADRIRSTNHTLAAIADLCEATTGSVEAIISYNYDDLLERVLGQDCQPIWDQTVPDDHRIPIYHVHGYLPRIGAGSSFDQILLTEEQYHRAASDVYSWSNLVQIRYLTSSVGLMVGLSLTDKNMRRLLDAIARTPLRVPTYALLQKPALSRLDEHDLDAIDRQARDYLELFQRSGADASKGGFLPGVKGPENAHVQIEQIIHAVERVDIQQNGRLLEELGVEAIWYDNHQEVADFLKSITGRERQPA